MIFFLGSGRGSRAESKLRGMLKKVRSWIYRRYSDSIFLIEILFPQLHIGGMGLTIIYMWINFVWPIHNLVKIDFFLFFKFELCRWKMLFVIS